jgi:hypothetical protein
MCFYFIMFRSQTIFSTLRISLLAMATLCSASQALHSQTWSNTNSTYPPSSATQNWATGSNWGGGVAPTITSSAIISNGGSAIIDSSVVANTVLLGNSANASLSHKLLIASGGSLTVNSTSTSAFRLFNTAGTHLVEVASGGSLTVNGTMDIGSSTGLVGSSSTFINAGTVRSSALAVKKQAVFQMTGGTLNVVTSPSVFGGSGSTAANEGQFVQTGGAFTGTSIQLSAGGTYQISGGSSSMSSSTSGLLFSGANATSSGGTIKIVGSGASGVSFGGLRYLNTFDQDKAKWAFAVDNSAGHITKINMVASGNAGGNLRAGSLDVSLSGGVLLSGTNKLDLIEAPSILATSNFINAADYTSGTAKLWVQGITDSTRDTLHVTLNSGASMGSIDVGASGNLTLGTSASFGYVSFSNASTPFTLGLGIVGGTLSNFTAALTAAGVIWTAGTNGYSVDLLLNPTVSGGNYFAWDFAPIDGAMNLTSLGVIPEPSTYALLLLAGLGLAAMRRRR